MQELMQKVDTLEKRLAVLEEEGQARQEIDINKLIGAIEARLAAGLIADGTQLNT